MELTSINPKILALNKDNCQQLNNDEYIDAMLHYTYHKNEPMVKLLVKNRDKIKKQSIIDILSTNGFCHSNDTASADYLIEVFREAGLDFKKENTERGHYAAKKGNVAGLQLFLKLNNNPNLQNSDGMTPLHSLVTLEDKYETIYWKKHKPNVENLTKNVKLLLLQPKTAINKQDNKGNTAFHYAANFKFINYLLAAPDGDLTIKNNNGETPFFYALQHRGITEEEKGELSQTYNDYQFNCLLNDPRTDINTQKNDGNSPLHYIIKNPRLTRIESKQHASLELYHCPTFSYDNIQAKQLIDHQKIQINKQNKNGESPLHYAAQPEPLSQTKIEKCFGQKNLIDLKNKITLENMQLLLDHKDTIIDLKNLNGETPLMYAITAQNIGAIKLLCAYARRNDVPNHKKLNINTSNNNGYTALDYAAAINSKNIINLLKSYGATHGSFFYKYKKQILACFATGITAMLASIMVYLHYH